ncbi:MAG: hypothetical protein P4L69_16355 [Desulfosporosinus sp.]|nr:hypothetical protein [Desulfosporosinus sp.]
MNTPSSHCPGFEDFRNLKSFLCKCHHCSTEIEIFSDEFNREHVCKKCGKQIDFTSCKVDAGASDQTPR